MAKKGCLQSALDIFASRVAEAESLGRSIRQMVGRFTPSIGTPDRWVQPTSVGPTTIDDVARGAADRCGDPRLGSRRFDDRRELRSTQPRCHDEDRRQGDSCLGPLRQRRLSTAQERGERMDVGGASMQVAQPSFDGFKGAPDGAAGRGNVPDRHPRSTSHPRCAGTSQQHQSRHHE